MRLRTPAPPPDLAPAPSAAGSSASDEIGRRRQRSTWRTRLVRGGVVVAVLGVFALATWLVGYSDVLTADQVRVTGADGALVETVTEAAAVPIGRPLARVDTAEVAANVETIPDVASVTVTRDWPSTVAISITGRVPLASLEGDEGWYGVDVEGVLFAPQAEPAADRPVLVAPDGAQGQQARAAGVGVADALPAQVLGDVARIEAPSPVEVRLVLRDGPVVVWGSAEDAERKADVLAVLLQTPATQYDVSVPDRPTIRPAPSG